MRSTSGRRELTFVLAVALVGLMLVIALVFTPWYPAAEAASTGVVTML
jgi:hypothetical protein